MDRISKGFAVFISLIIVISSLSLMMVKPTVAQSIPTPSVPEFKVRFVDRSYDVPVTTTTTTDPFTGKQVTTSSGGYHVTNKTIDITINNEAYSPIDLENGTIIQLYYLLRTKGHFANWEQTIGNGYSSTLVKASNSDHKVITLVIGSGNFYVPDGGQEDFQVKAQAGYEYPYFGGHIMPLYTAFENLAESDWSPTQTVTIPASSVSSSSTPTPSVPEFSWLTILPLLLCVPIALIIAKRRLKTSNLK